MIVLKCPQIFESKLLFHYLSTHHKFCSCFISVLRPYQFHTGSK